MQTPNFVGKSFGGSEIFRIFAPSNHYSGTKTAGATSSLFCAPTYWNRNTATPSPEPGNRPGVSAIMNLTARSVAFLCQIHYSYVNIDNRPHPAAGPAAPGACLAEVGINGKKQRSILVQVLAGRLFEPRRDGGGLLPRGGRPRPLLFCHPFIINLLKTVTYGQ